MGAVSLANLAHRHCAVVASVADCRSSASAPRATARRNRNRQRTAELARMNRHAVAGEITAAIAHELKQPLTAILSNAEAAHDLLGRKDHDPAAIREVVADIIDEDTRAADVL